MVFDLSPLASRRAAVLLQSSARWLWPGPCIPVGITQATSKLYGTVVQPCDCATVVWPRNVQHVVQKVNRLAAEIESIRLETA